MKHLVVVNKLEVPKKGTDGFSEFTIGACLPGVVYSEVKFYSIDNETVNARVAVKMALELQKFMKYLAGKYEAERDEAVNDLNELKKLNEINEDSEK